MVGIRKVFGETRPRVLSLTADAKERKLVVGNEPKPRAKKPPIDTTIPVYKKVSKSGKARYLSVTKLIPEDWVIVEVTTVSLENNILNLKVRKVA